MVSQTAVKCGKKRPGRRFHEKPTPVRTLVRRPLRSPQTSFDGNESVVLAVLARLGQGQRALAPRRDRPGNGGVAGPTHAVARARTRGDLLARDRVWIAGAVAVAPAHQ